MLARSWLRRPTGARSEQTGARSEQTGARNEHGSALLLVPTGVLIVVILGALMVDSAAAFLAEREAEATAAGIANDVATLAIDENVLRFSGIYRIAPRRVAHLKSRVTATAEQQLSAVFVPGSTAVDVFVTGLTEVSVTVSGQARRIIGPFGWSSLSPTYPIAATATARVAVSG